MNPIGELQVKSSSIKRYTHANVDKYSSFDEMKQKFEDNYKKNFKEKWIGRRFLALDPKI